VRRLGLAAGLVVVLAALIVTGLYLSNRWSSPEPSAAPGRPTPRALEFHLALPPAPAATEPGTATPNVVRVGVRALLGERRVDSAVQELLIQGQVAAAMKLLEQQSDAASLYRLGAACSVAVRADSDSLAEAADRSAVAAAATPELSATFAPLIAARADFRRRFAAGCRAAPEDRERVSALLTARAAQGDADSQYLLALRESGDDRIRRLQSAALLGSAPAALALSLPTLASATASPERSAAAAIWLKGAAKLSPEAALDYALCQAQGCAGSTDRESAKSSVESLARQGDLAAIGVLAAGSGFALPAALDIDPVPAPDTPPIESQAARRYAWSAFGARLARDGCALASGELIGALPVAAVQSESTLAASLSPAELDAGRAAAQALWSEAGADAEAAQGCR